MKTVTTASCLICGETGTVELTDDQFERYTAYVEGKGEWFIQNAIPDVAAGLREQLMNGTHDQCFNEMFPEDEDEDEDEEYEEAGVEIAGHEVYVSRDLTDEEGRTRYQWAVYNEDWNPLESGNDLHTPVGHDPGPEQMLKTLLAFLTAWGEALARGPESKNYELFHSTKLAEWVTLNIDEIVWAIWEGEEF